jgi:hypothetical protein
VAEAEDVAEDDPCKVEGAVAEEEVEKTVTRW